MIDEALGLARPGDRRLTRAQQRAATRLATLNATAEIDLAALRSPQRRGGGARSSVAGVHLGPVAGRAAVDRQWAAIKPLIVRAAADLLDRSAG